MMVDWIMNFPISRMFLWQEGQYSLIKFQQQFIFIFFKITSQIQQANQYLEKEITVDVDLENGKTSALTVKLSESNELIALRFVKVNNLSQDMLPSLCLFIQHIKENYFTQWEQDQYLDLISRQTINLQESSEENDEQNSETQNQIEELQNTLRKSNIKEKTEKDLFYDRLYKQKCNNQDLLEQLNQSNRYKLTKKVTLQEFNDWYNNMMMNEKVFQKKLENTRQEKLKQQQQEEDDIKNFYKKVRIESKNCISEEKMQETCERLYNLSQQKLQQQLEDNLEQSFLKSLHQKADLQQSRKIINSKYNSKQRDDNIAKQYDRYSSIKRTKWIDQKIYQQINVNEQ